MLRFYKTPLENFLVVHDDLDLPVGTLHLAGRGFSRSEGSGLNHREIGDGGFPRLRIGIGRPPGRMDSADYVLEDFPKAEREIILQVLERARQAVEMFITTGLVTTMNQFNGVLTKD